MAKLAKDLDAIGIHGIAGQQIDTGTLEAGSLIKNIEESTGSDGETPCWYFLTSTDGGKSWFKHLTWERPETVA